MTALMEVQGISKRFVKRLDLAGRIAERLGADIHEETVHAVDNVSLAVQPGEVVGLSVSQDAESRRSGGWWPEF